MDLEVEVVRRRLRVAGVADEADHVAGLHLVAVDGERRERREVRVVELVALPVAQPKAVPAEVVPADREDRPVRDGEERGPERREDVLAVMPADARARADPKVSANDDGRRRGRRSRRARAAPRRPSAASGRRSPGGAGARPASGGLGSGLRVFGTPAGPIGLRRRRRRRVARVVSAGVESGRLRMADEDLGPGGQAAVVGGEDDVERVDRAARVRRPVGDGRVDDLLEHDQIAPVAERHAQVRRRGDGRAEDDEIGRPSSR